MKTPEEIKQKAIELDGAIMMQQEAINTFENCFERKPTEQEKAIMKYDLSVLIAQKDVINWILE